MKINLGLLGVDGIASGAANAERAGLKRCPKCNGKVVLLYGDGGETAIIQCIGCGYSKSGKYSKIVKAWNE